MPEDVIEQEPELLAAIAARALGAKTKGVYACINAVSRDIANAGGIAKTRVNEQQHFKFRGIEDVQNALAPLLAQHGLVILPRCLSRQVVERQARGGGALFTVVVEVEFDIVCVADGSMHVVRTYGEAMDSADKATNKSLSAAYKYMAFQTFCIPTAGDDADAVTHDDVGLPILPAKNVYREFAHPTVAPPRDPDTFVGDPVTGEETPATPAEQVFVSDVKRRATKNPKYTRYTVTTSAGEQLATINENLGRQAEKCWKEKIAVHIVGEKSEFPPYRELTGIRPAELEEIPF